MSLLGRLSDESLDELSSELASLDADDMAEFISALDTLDQLATQLQPVLPTDNALDSDGARRSGSIKAQGPSAEFVDAGIDELAAMLVELMSTFESSLEYDAANNANWCSPGGRCEVSKSGQSSALLWSLQQDPEAVFAEYRIRLDGQEVWSWSDKVWPDLSLGVSLTSTVRIPMLCFEAITHHLEQHSAEWVERWHEANLHHEESNHTSA